MSNKRKGKGTKPAKSSPPKKTFLLTPSQSSGTKVYYTREDDEAIVKMLGNGKNIKEIAESIGHSPASVTYRANRVLSLMQAFDEYDYGKHELLLTTEQKVQRKAEREVAVRKQADTKI